MFRAGQRVRMLPENRLAKVYHLEERQGRWVVGLIFEDTRQAQELVFGSWEELRARLAAIPSLVESFQAGDGLLPREHCLAFVDALRIRLAHAFDPHYAVSVTQVDLLPHQVDAVYRHILPRPRVRFLLADDPGLGKTIMAGLVLKELKARGLVRTVLVVVPAHLQDQWRREMWEWFREEFTLLNRTVLHGLPGSEFFERNPQILVSMDFARQEHVREALRARWWDLVIVDEAHKFSATRYGHKVKKTKRYQLGEDLAGRSSHLLFLTATPHRGDDEAYFLLLNLLEPRLFARAQELKAAARGGLPFVLRRTKEQVTDLAGNKLFKRREVKTLAVGLTPAERRLYEAVTDYVGCWYRTVSGRTDRHSRNVALALTVLQRRLSSSLFAVRESLRRRRAKLRGLLESWERRLEEEEALPVLDEDGRADLEEQSAAQWESLQGRLEGLTAAKTPEDLRAEIAELDKLIQLAQEAERAGEEAKVGRLREMVENWLRHQPDEKLIIFTEFKDTLVALQRRLEAWGFRTAVIHGEMDLAARIEQERFFRDEAQVLIGTDAAGEGLNLQFARLMVNFDLPWNPNRLEQRMGRIHRYGQKRDCFVFNMLYPETREGQVMERLLAKLELMRQRLGDTVYDVVGQLLEGVRLEELIMEAIIRRDTAEVERRIEVDLERRLEEYRRALEEGALAGHHIDLSAVLAGDRDSRRQRLVPWDIERFVRLVVPLVGGECQAELRKPGVFRLRLPGPFLRQWRLEQDAFARGLRVAFERRVGREAGVEFLAPGHPLLEALVEHFLRKSRPVRGLLAHPGGRSGVLWLFRAGIQDGFGRPVLERLVAVFWDAERGEWAEVDPRMVWDLGPWPEWVPVPRELLEALEGGEAGARDWVLGWLAGLEREARERREREARIKTEWLKQSFEYLIAESNAKLVEYWERAERGKDMGLAIQQEEENLKRLVREKAERLKGVELERTLTLVEPELEAVFLVGPGLGGQEDPEARRRIEAAGMAFVMAYERAQGRNPRDVSAEYLGYDIVSEGAGELRYIEVKAFAGTGKVRFTPHEWQLARRLGDEYWLYVVENAAGEPKLRPVRNPARNLPVEEEVGVVAYVVRWEEFSGPGAEATRPGG